METCTVAYGERDTQVYDAWEPEGPSREVTVALVHGGFWRAVYDRHHLRPLAAALAADGFHVASLEYARVGMPGGGWPGAGADVVAGLGAVCSDARLPGPVVAVGHSAGGHLAVWAASESRVPALGGVVALAGVVDLRAADALHLGADAARGLLGGSPEEEPEAWADADPGGQRLTSPLVLLTGDSDDDVPHQVSQTYAASRTAADAPCRVVVHEGAGHFDVVDPGHPAYRTLVEALASLSRPPGS